jgi:hypothetical protein
MAGTIVLRQPNPDGTITLFYDDGTSLTVGTPRDPVQVATQAGQTAAAQVRAQYADPWYKENVLDPMNQVAEQQAKDRAQKLKNEAATLRLQGRTAEANIKAQQAAVELRKLELRQSNQQFGQTMGQRAYEFDRGQQLQASGMIANARGAGNAAQRVDLGRRLTSFGTQSTALADIAAGRVPQGAFAMTSGAKPVSEADYLAGLLGATPDQMHQRDANDRSLAQQIGSNATRIARGSVESLSPYEKSYLGSYLGATGFDPEQFDDEYRRAGVMQGRRR